MSINPYDQQKSAGQGGALRLDTTPQPAVTRAREPVTRSRGLVRGQFPSTKMKRMIAWESQLEQKACYHFEFCSRVILYREQPETLYLPDGERMYRYTPDFELVLSDGQIAFVEIKPLSKLFAKSIYERLQLADNFLKEKGYQFIVITDEELNYSIRNRNFSILRSYLKIHLSDRIIQEANLWLLSEPYPTVEKLSHFVGLQSISFALIAQQHIGFDFHQPLNNDSEIHSIQNKQTKNETCYFTYRSGLNFEQRILSFNSNLG